MADVGQRKGKGTEIEKVAAEAITLVRPTCFRIIGFIRDTPTGEADECPFAVYVLDRNVWPE
jgi:hypothetical protein